MKLVISAVALVSAMLIMVASCALFPDERIEGNWRNPEVKVSDVKIATLAGSDKTVLSYFFNITQSANLRNQRYVNKGNAWQRRITERVHRIAAGFETVLVDSTNGVTLLPIENHVTAFKHVEGTLLLQSSWSAYSENAVYVVSLSDSSAREVTTGDPGTKKMSFVPLESHPTLNVIKEYPGIKERLEQTYLRKPDRKNRYEQTRKPNKTN